MPVPRAILLTTCLFTLLALFGCSSPGVPLADLALEVNATLDDKTVVLGPGDKLKLTAPSYDDWAQETTVLPDGTASFLHLDSVLVGGLTLEALDLKLEQAYGQTFLNPELTVVVDELAPRQVIIIGEVNNPGAQEIDVEGLTLVQAIGRAGGPIQKRAYMENTLLIRWDPTLGKQISWEIDASLKNWGSSEAIYLQPYDTLVVPSKDVIGVNDWIQIYISNNIPWPWVFYQAFI